MSAVIDPSGIQGGHMAAWTRVANVNDIPQLGARVVKSADGDIAVFRNSEDEIFALRDSCPHRGGPLSQGIVFGRHVACPLHNWTIGLEDGSAMAPDTGCAGRYPVKVEDGVVYLQFALPD
jgi:nitrite reductase (NADH) small subunit